LSLRQAEALRELFAQFHPQLTGHPLGDFSGLRSSAAQVCELAPRTAGTAARIVRAAYEGGVPVRIRGQGHSLNGSSLPLASELLLATRDLRKVRFEAPGSVTAGGGVVLWILQRLLQRHGFELPVLNDGYAGPSVGGYLAAGGFGPRSSLHGAFWHNVLEVRMIDGRGELLVIPAEDARFPWLFGSMGQLGVVFEARLAIVPLDAAAAAPAYPAGASFTVPLLAAEKPPAAFAAGVEEGLFWFTLFVPDEHLEEAHAALDALERRHHGALRFQERYNYPIRQRGGIAPLVYPEARALTATGAWGWLNERSGAAAQRLADFDRDFMALARSRPYFRRYVQSELPQGPEVYEACFGPAVYARLRELKRELDPRALFNRGAVFPAS
jgi:FAD/FMN-containing dehydrogenase